MKKTTAKKTLKTLRKPNPYAKKILLQYKVNSEEMRIILGKAHHFTKGNLSAYARYAALNFKPNKGDFEK